MTFQLCEYLVYTSEKEYTRDDDDDNNVLTGTTYCRGMDHAVVVSLTQHSAGYSSGKSLNLTDRSLGSMLGS